MFSNERHNSTNAAVREGLPRVLPDYLVRQRWFGGKARTIKSTEVLDIIQIPFGDRVAFLVIAQVTYADGAPEIYALPLVPIEPGSGTIADAKSGFTLRSDGIETAFCDALQDKDFMLALYESIRKGSSFRGGIGELVARPTSGFLDAGAEGQPVPEPALMKGEQSNTSVRFGDRFILKFFRRLEQGINPDVEIGIFLTDRASFKHSPVVRGSLEYRDAHIRTCALGILQDFVPNKGDAWRYTLSALEDYLNVAASKGISNELEVPNLSVVESAYLDIPQNVPERIGAYWKLAGLLGRRTGQLHVALASDSTDPSFRPEHFSATLQHSQFESMRGLTLQAFQMLENRLSTLPASMRENATKVKDLGKKLLGCFETFSRQKLTAECIRIHGDYHLGQVLFTGSDFVIIDFEGEPARSIEERRKKRCPLQDVAGMLRSFHYASYAALHKRESKPDSRSREDANLLEWARYWQRWVSVGFLKEYLSATINARFLPSSKTELTVLLEAYLLERAAWELGYELNNRPEWVELPIQGILDLLAG